MKILLTTEVPALKHLGGPGKFVPVLYKNLYEAGKQQGHHVSALLDRQLVTHPEGLKYTRLSSGWVR